MKVDLIISADDIKEEDLRGKVVVVIDMLRATSVIVTALNNKAKEVFPILTVEEAFSKKNELVAEGISPLLGGERKAVRIERFDFSNSPLEYTAEKVEGKSIILSTTNGTRAINLSLNSEEILIGAMINSKAVIKLVKEINKDVVFINAGTNGEFSMDDFICSGYMISLLCEGEEKNKYEISDISKTAKYIYENNLNIIDFIKNARHYNILMELGLNNDLEYCCKKDIIDVVPRVDKRSRSIKL